MPLSPKQCSTQCPVCPPAVSQSFLVSLSKYSNSWSSDSYSNKSCVGMQSASGYKVKAATPASGMHLIHTRWCLNFGVGHSTEGLQLPEVLCAPTLPEMLEFCWCGWAQGRLMLLEKRPGHPGMTLWVCGAVHRGKSRNLSQAQYHSKSKGQQMLPHHFSEMKMKPLLSAWKCLTLKLCLWWETLRGTTLGAPPTLLAKEAML